MINLLFNVSFWYDVLAVIAAISIIYLVFKFPQSKIYITTIAYLAMLVSAVFSVSYINAYLSAKGGIFGAITGVFKPNEVVVTEELTFNFKNIMLTETAEANVYEAKFVEQKVLQLTPDVYYGVFVNDAPCTFVENGVDYVSATYQYNFYDKEQAVVMNDSLNFRFAFNKKQCELNVYTRGGSAAVKFWNSFFNKNTFVVQVKQINKINTGNAFAEYNKVEFELNGGIINKQLVKNNDFAHNVEAPTSDLFKFLYWTTDNVNEVIVEEYPITQNTKFIAKMENVEIKALNDYSWQEISEISERGMAQDYFKIGDIKRETLTSGEVAELGIIGFEHDNLSSGGKAKITFGLMNLLNNTHELHFVSGSESNPTNLNYEICTLRRNVLPEIYNSMSNELKNAIKVVDKTIVTNATPNGNFNATGTTETLQEKLFIFSAIEIVGNSKIPASSVFAKEGKQYEYWQTIKNGAYESDRILKFNGVSQFWHLRSKANDKYMFWGVSQNGMITTYNPYSTYGKVVFGFCI